jgi:putative oxidoreductase
MMDAGLLVGRLVLGTMMAAHGAQKLFGWFGGYGLAATAAFLESLGFRPGRNFALIAGLAEVGGGAMVALGLFGPAGPALVVSVMIVAAATVHWPNGLFATTNGIELPLLYGAGGAMLALTGPGVYSTDALFGLQSLWTPALAWAALAVGALGGTATLFIRSHGAQVVPA